MDEVFVYIFCRVAGKTGIYTEESLINKRH